MIKLSGSVGKIGLNKKHDVALVQRIMGAIKVRTRFGLKPIWSKKPDGRYTREMEPAIICLQEHMGQKPTAKLEPTIQTLNALTKVAPYNMRNLSAVAGTTSLFTTGQSNPRAERAARDLEAKAPFPKQERKALAEALRRVGKETGFCLRRKRDFVTSKGSFASEMGFDIATLPEAGKGQEATRAVSKILRATPEWSALSPIPMACKTKLQLNSLKGLGTGPLSADDKKLLGLTSPPREPVLLACAKGCASLIRSGRAAKPDGKKEAAIIIEAASNADPQLGKVLRVAVKRPVGDFSFLPTTVSNAAAGIAMLESRVSGAVQSLNNFDASAARLVEKYFKPFLEGGLENEINPEVIAEIIAIRIERALGFLTGRPFKQIFLPNIHPGVPFLVTKMFLGDFSIVAIQSGNRIFLHEERFNAFNGTTQAAVLLHEAIHTVLVVGKKEDQKYIWQDVTTLGVRDAVDNADSYVAVVFDDVIGQIGQFREIRE